MRRHLTRYRANIEPHASAISIEILKAQSKSKVINVPLQADFKLDSGGPRQMALEAVAIIADKAQLVWAASSELARLSGILPSLHVQIIMYQDLARLADDHLRS